MTEMDDLRREHAEETIGRALADLLDRVVRATAPTYPPVGYSDAGVWNRQALEDALQDWVTTRLLGRGDLARMLASAATPSRLRGMLTTSFGQFLTNRRQRSSATNLFQRIVKVLHDDARFAPVGTSRSSAAQQWTLADSPAEHGANEQAIEMLIKAAASRTNDELGVVHYGPYSLKSSPILRTPRLADFLAFLLEQSDGSMSPAELFQVFRHRFNLTEPVTVELESNVASPGLDEVGAQVETAVLAQSVLARVGREHALLIRALHNADGDVQSAAASVGVKPGELAAAVDRVMALIAEDAGSSDDAIAVYRSLTESLFLTGEDR
jgi:hypothetical protein